MNREVILQSYPKTVFLTLWIIIAYLLTVVVFAAEVTAQAAPTIKSFAPPVVSVGRTITITGTNFSTTASENTVTFAVGQTATPRVATATSMTVTVPEGAKTGTMTVTTNGVTSVASKSELIIPYVMTINPTTPATYFSNSGVAWSDELDMFVAVGGIVGGSQPASIQTSRGGLHWVAQNSGNTVQIAMNDVVWSDKLSMFVAVGGAFATVLTWLFPKKVDTVKRNISVSVSHIQPGRDILG